MAARPRTTFNKLQKERARQEKQAAKRARRQGKATTAPEDGAGEQDEPPMETIAPPNAPDASPSDGEHL